MILGFTRRVEAAVVDWTEARNRGLIDWEPSEKGIKDDEFSIIVVPTDLLGRVVVVMPLDTDGKPLNMTKLIKEADLKKSPVEIMRRALEKIIKHDIGESDGAEFHANSIECGDCVEMTEIAKKALAEVKECI